MRGECSRAERAIRSNEKDHLEQQGRSLQAKIKQRRAGLTEFRNRVDGLRSKSACEGRGSFANCDPRRPRAYAWRARLTDFAYHRPPRDVLMPRALTASAIC